MGPPVVVAFATAPHPHKRSGTKPHSCQRVVRGLLRLREAVLRVRCLTLRGAVRWPHPGRRCSPTTRTASEECRMGGPCGRCSSEPRLRSSSFGSSRWDQCCLWLPPGATPRRAWWPSRIRASPLAGAARIGATVDAGVTAVCSWHVPLAESRLPTPRSSAGVAESGTLSMSAPVIMGSCKRSTGLGDQVEDSVQVLATLRMTPPPNRTWQ